MNNEKENTTTAITTLEKNISDNVLNRVKNLETTGGLNLPPNYSAGNALKSAWLILQNTLDKDKRPVLSVCLKESIANSLLDMVIQGLSPAKKQCYFIPYGNQLQLSRSYMGSIAVTKRLHGVKDVFANCIYEGDVFEYVFDLGTGLKQITKHNQSFKNIDTSKILGAYAIIIREGLPPFVEIMNMKQIRAAWEQGAAKGNSGAHTKFSDEMAKKSVINRACKIFWNTSNDSDLLIESINKTTDVEDLPDTPYVVEEIIDKEIAENANKEVVDIKKTDANQEKTEKKETSHTDEDFWENPKAIIGKINSMTDYKTLDQFVRENLSRISTISGTDGDNIQDAIDAKAAELNTAKKAKRIPS